MARCEECLHYQVCLDTETRHLRMILAGDKAERCKQFMHTADVVPKSEVDKLEYTLLGVMHSVDKWLEGDELEQDEVNRAITMREKTLRIIDNVKTEVARAVISDVIEILNDVYRKCDAKDINTILVIVNAITELKKKYTEADT